MSDPNYKSFHKHSCVRHEDILEDTPYAFSYNPEPMKLKENGEYLFKREYNRMNKLLYLLKGSLVEVYPETSPSGKIHFHGTITILNFPTFCLIDLYTLQACGTYEIDLMTDKEKWTTYCIKQSKYWKPYCKKRKLKYCISNAFIASLSRPREVASVTGKEEDSVTEEEQLVADV